MSSSKSNTLTDHQLIERFRLSHDNKYVGELFNRYAHLVLGLCIKYYKDEDKAQDAVMNIFELLIKELKRHEIEYFKSWLYTVSKNYCLQDLRKQQTTQKKKSGYEVFLAETMEFDRTEHLNGASSEKEAMLQRLENEIPNLKYNQRQCINLFYLKGRTYAEIATETGYSLKEIKSYIQNGKRNLKISLSDNKS